MPGKVIKGAWIDCNKKKEGNKEFFEKRATGGEREKQKSDLREIHASQYQYLQER